MKKIKKTLGPWGMFAVIVLICFLIYTYFYFLLFIGCLALMIKFFLFDRDVIIIRKKKGY